nr:ECF transporter S component [Candidatus Burarchaeum sp.]
MIEGWIEMNRKFLGIPAIVLFASMTGAFLHLSGSPPNIELLMPFILSGGLMLGPAYGFAIGALVRASYDFQIVWAGPWTLATAFSYGVVGLLAGFLPLLNSNKKAFSRKQLVAAAVALTVVYDISSLAFFSMLFGLPMLLALGPQIPFTINHILGNALFVFALSPLINLAIEKMRLDLPFSFNFRLPSPSRAPFRLK